MFEQGRFLSSFLFQDFQELSLDLSMSLILISLNIGRQNYDHSACSQKRTCVCRARVLVYFLAYIV